MEAAVLWVTAVLVRAYGKSAHSLEDREQRLKALIETAVDGVIIIDTLGRVQEYNPASERLFGYSPKEVIGNNVRMLMPSPYRDEHDRYLRRYRTTGRRHIIGIGREVEGRRKDGSTFPMELSVGEARPGGRQVFVGIIRDVTARHVAEQKLRTAKEQAEAASHAKSLFLANISHEIRTPMNAVLGYTQVIEREPDLPEQFRRPLKAIRTAGDHLLELIEEILDLSKIEAGAMELEARDFDLRTLLEGIVEMFRIRCEQKQLQWETTCGVRHSAVRGDDKKLRQVLINLLGNAIKFTDEGRVGIHVTQSGPRYQFSVTDTGPGITEEGRKRLFQPFQQAEEGSRKGGTGLGLTISRRQIELMGGVLGLETAPGRGSRFFFSLELEQRSAPEALLPAADQEVVHLAPGTRLRALVVDDVEDNRELLSRVLESAGIETLVATDGKDALVQLEDERIDVVFMDVRMPVMDGITAIRHIRSRWPERRIFSVAITASGLMHPRSHYMEAGFDDFLAKPYRFEKIWTCLEKHLGVVFEREGARNDRPRPVSGPDSPGDYRIPAALRERLLRAAELNGLTDIEAAIAELRELGEETHPLAAHLEALLSSYDTAGLVALLGQIPVSDGS
jgi:PAS domain S-box-containing protein